MTLFHDLLSQIKQRLDKEEKRTGEIAEIISLTIGVTVDQHTLTIKKGTLIVSVSPTIKMAIMVKKEALIASFKEKNISVYAIA